MFDDRHSEDSLASEASDSHYHAPMTGLALDVAAAIRDFEPDVPQVKLQKLLYYCQGHHLAATGEALFKDPVVAWDMGPVVAGLWRAETRPEDDHRGNTERLDEAQLNTIGYVMSRYGGMSGNDLIRLSHNEPPWQRANEHREAGGSVGIPVSDIATFFVEKKKADEAEDPIIDINDLYVLVEGAEHRRDRPARTDTHADLQALLERHQQ